MMQYDRMTTFLLVLVFSVGCAHVSPEEGRGAREQQPVSVAAPAKDMTSSGYLPGLERNVGNWNQRIDALTQSLQELFLSYDRLAAAPLGADKQQYLMQRKRFLLVYQERLKKLKEIQQRLVRERDALVREALYAQLITDYLNCLGIEKDLRTDAALEARKTKALAEMKDRFGKGDYAAVIDLYNQAVGASPGDAGTEDNLYYAVSLSRVGRKEDAVKAAEQIVGKEVLVGCENAPLMYELGEILIDAERYEAAETVLKEVFRFYQAEDEWYNNVQQKVALFQSGVGSLKMRNKLHQAVAAFEKGERFFVAYGLCKEAFRACLDDHCRQEVQSIQDKLVMDAAALIDRKLEQMDALISETKIYEAHELFASLETAFPDDDYPPLLIGKTALIQQKRFRLFQEEIKSRGELERQKYEKAIKLVESEQYDEAILLFDQLQGTQYEAQAEEDKAMAINLLARTSRTKAGELFLQAMQEEDVEMRKTYLVESYRLLKGVIDRYPHSQYAEKIGRNLADVCAEIEKVDPEFLVNEQGGAPSPDSAPGNEGRSLGGEAR